MRFRRKPRTVIGLEVIRVKPDVFHCNDCAQLRRELPDLIEAALKRRTIELPRALDLNG